MNPDSIVRRLIPVATLAVCAVAAPCAATPVVRITWGDCDVIKADESGLVPGVVGWQVAATGLEGNYAGFRAVVDLAVPFVPHAWQFFDVNRITGMAGCQGASRLFVTNFANSCPLYPATQAAVEMVQGTPTDVLATTINMSADFDRAVTAVPTQRYTLLKILFDHSHDGACQGCPGVCDDYDRPLCFVVRSVTLSVPDGPAGSTPVPLTMETTSLTWHDPTNAQQCAGATPAWPTTWGAVKSQYR